MQVLANIAQRLEAMHAAGYAHRDLKPANVMWLPRENQWTLIDFGCAAKVGREAPLSFTMAYAAPEVIAAWKSGEKTVTAAETMDAWSLGVMVFELLTGRMAFDVFMQGREEVCIPSTRPISVIEDQIDSSVHCITIKARILFVPLASDSAHALSPSALQECIMNLWRLCADL